MNEKELQNKIIKRVRFVYFGKQIYRPIIVRSVLLIALVFVGSIYASIPHIMQNMSNVNSFGSFYNFTVSAFINTELIVQIICFGIIAVLMYAIWDKIRDEQKIVL